MNMMKDARYELKKYCGKNVELEGKFKDFYDNIKYVYNEECKNYLPKTQRIMPMPIVEEKEYNPVQICDKGSLITEISGCGQFSDIHLDHIILQCNIKKTYGISLGSKIRISGYVSVYNAKNKIGGIDYCICPTVVEKVD